MTAVGRLHVITDETVQSRFTHVEIAERAIAGGADVIQFRDKWRPSGELFAVAQRVKEVCGRSGVPLIINDRADIALAVGADGVHLGADDLPIALARRLLGAERIIGATASTLERAREAQQAGADYVGFGHIYPTASKAKKQPAKGVTPLGDVARALRIPVIAIGGITAANAAPVLGSGAWGIAVIGAVCAAEDPQRAADELRRVIDGYHSVQGR